jgi:hypothetical protein
MRTLRRASTVVVVALAFLAGCGGPSAHQGGAATYQSVTGMLVRVGGPPPGSPVPLPGRVAANDAAGHEFTAMAGRNGHFQLSLPAGTYRLTGHSPQVWSNGREMLCLAERSLHVAASKPVRGIRVVCSIA